MAVPDEFSSSQFKTLDDVLKVSIPQAPHQNHHRLFLLARGIRTLEVALGRCYSREELKQSFLRWYALAKGKLRPGRSKDAYLVEFLEAYGDVEHPLGLTTIQLAWQLAHTKPLPPESSYFDSQELRLLVALCWHLQVKAGTQPFYLAARTCQRLFGHDTHSTAATWLKALRAAGIIVEETKGTLQNGASHYRYLGADAPTAPTKLAG